MDINCSHWDTILEQRNDDYYALRLGFREVKSLRQDDMKLLIESRENGYTSINVLRDAGISEAALKSLSDSDAFRSIGLDRREALWEVSTTDKPEALFAGPIAEDAKGKFYFP